jgi:hypothetical protein
MCFLSRPRILDRRRSSSRDRQADSDLRNLRTTSAISLTLPATSVPQRDSNFHNHVLEDAKALRDIFSTPSSTRGHESARVIPAPDSNSKRLASDVHVATQTPHGSKNSRLGAFGHAVKQRLSESRLSKASPKTMVKRKPSLNSPQTYAMLSTSFTSTELTDLLMSRTASEGGYDSDAKDISTLRLRMSSNHESLNVSPEYLVQPLDPQDRLPPEKTNSAPAIQEGRPSPVAMAAESQDIHEEKVYHEITPTTANAQEVSVTEIQRTSSIGTVRQDEGRKILPSASQSLSDDQSIHLGDMHISQRLASTSVMPMISLSSTDFSSGTGHDDGTDLPKGGARIATFDHQHNSMDNNLPWQLHGRTSMAGEYAGFVAPEHNRKPSDPRTRMIFEHAADGRRLHPKWKPVTSASSVQTSLKARHSARDNASSHYMSESDLPDRSAASVVDIVPPGTIKNANSLAVPSRRVSVCVGQRYGSLGPLSNTEEGGWFGNIKNQKQHSLQEFEVLGPYEKDTQELSMNGECGTMSRESRFTEDTIDQNSRELTKLLLSVEANEGMSEITEDTLQLKRFERMEEGILDAQVLGPRSRGGSHDTRSISEGWLTQGRRSGFGYDFIKRTASHDSRLSYVRKIATGPKNETAAPVWGRVFKKARKGGPTESSSQPMLNIRFWSNLAGRKTSRSSLNQQQSGEADQPRSVASEGSAAPSELMHGYLDPLENHQRITVEARKSLPRLSGRWGVKTGEDASSPPTSVKESTMEKSLFDARRYTISGVNVESEFSPALLKGDFPSWCKFPSHSHKVRNGPAGQRDGVRVRDFCPATPDLERFNFPSNLTLEKNRSASSQGLNFRRSWRKRALGHVRRKSKSMTFSRGSASPKDKVAHKSLFWQLRDFYRSQSSDLRRLQGGHRSSVTLARESKYPDLDIPAGFGPLMPLAFLPTPFPRRSLSQARISESTGEYCVDLIEQRDAKIRRPSPCISTGHETENNFPAGEANRWSPRKGMQKTTTSKGVDSTVSSRISEEYVRSITESDCDLRSAQHDCGNGTYASVLSVSASNGFGDGNSDLGAQTCEFRMASTELRDSTIDFRKALMEREQQSRDELLKLARGLDGVGKDDGESESGEKKEHSKDKP